MNDTHTMLDIQVEGRQLRVDTKRGVVELLDSDGRVASSHPIQAAAGSEQGEFEDETEVRDFFE